jgi:hypothetical protein
MFTIFNIMSDKLNKVFPLQYVLILLVKQVNELTVDLAHNLETLLAPVNEVFTQGTSVAQHAAY